MCEAVYKGKSEPKPAADVSMIGIDLSKPMRSLSNNEATLARLRLDVS